MSVVAAADAAVAALDQHSLKVNILCAVYSTHILWHDCYSNLIAIATSLETLQSEIPAYYQFWKLVKIGPVDSEILWLEVDH